MQYKLPGCKKIPVQVCYFKMVSITTNTDLSIILCGDIQVICNLQFTCNLQVKTLTRWDAAGSSARKQASPVSFVLFWSFPTTALGEALLSI